MKQTRKEKVEALKKLIGPDIDLGLVVIGDLLDDLQHNTARCNECREKAHEALDLVMQTIKILPSVEA